jgi:hypothetical protein
VKEEEGGREREKKSFNLFGLTLPLNVHAKQGTCSTRKTCKMSCKYFGKFKSGESEQNRSANVGESCKSGTFPKKTILANSHASGHSLLRLHFQK